MTPDNPQDPQKGKVEETTPDEAKTSKAKAAEEKTAAKADATGKGAKTEGEAKPKKKPAAKKSTKKEPAAKAKDAAAEETGVDKAAAKAGAEAEDEPKRPKRKTSTSKAEEKAADRPKPAARRAPAGAKRRGSGDAAEPLVVVRAHAKYVRTSARKARLVCDHIRGKDVAQARAILAFTPRGAAEAWSKLLESAVANAEHNHELVGEELRVTRVFADEGPTLKRFRPRAMGRATRIRKRTSHLTIELTPKEQ